MTILRRSFLKLGAALVGGSVIAQYAEPMVVIPARPRLSDWVEDRGDHYIVRVPAMKEFARESMGKPTIFLLGQSAIVRNVTVLGFVNIIAPRSGMVAGCTFDASKMAVGRERAVVEISNSTHSLTLCDSHLIGNGLSWLALQQIKELELEKRTEQ